MISMRNIPCKLRCLKIDVWLVGVGGGGGRGGGGGGGLEPCHSGVGVQVVAFQVSYSLALFPV